MQKKLEKIIKVEYRGFTITLSGIFRRKSSTPIGWSISIYDDTNKTSINYSAKKEKLHDAEIEAKTFIDKISEEEY